MTASVLPILQHNVESCVDLGPGASRGLHAQVSSAEQEVSCSGSSMQGHFDAIAELINSNSISNADRSARHLHCIP